MFGKHSEFCHLALLPSYLERNNSSLVYQVDYFIQNSEHLNSAFYLRNHADLFDQLQQNEKNQVPSILWGVSFGLLDFIEEYQLPLEYTTVIETGGMKGGVRNFYVKNYIPDLSSAFSISDVAGEYGMTELMSQAYAKQKGIYSCPPWISFNP
ncbi:MAG: hypothetical protein R2852_05585 [Bacteroidia bacterium]